MNRTASGVTGGHPQLFPTPDRLLIAVQRGIALDADEPPAVERRLLSTLLERCACSSTTPPTRACRGVPRQARGSGYLDGCGAVQSIFGFAPR
jgi:hypothetical protein